jgi:membrane fusion protein (multidrug efflux system)
VSSLVVKKQTVPAVFEYVAVAQSSHLVEIRARVEGYLDKIAYKEGDTVKEGDLLFQIDPRPFQAALAQAQAVLAHQKAALWESTRSVDRFTPLYEQKAASQRDLDNAIAQKLGAQAAVEGASASVIQAEINLGYTTIHAPIAGSIAEAKYREGSLVGPSSGQSLLTTIYTLDPIWVNFNVSEGDLLKYHVEESHGRLQFPKDMNFEIEVVLSDGSILPTKGKVDFADPALQQNTGSMSVRTVMANPKFALRPGQFVRARLKGAVYPDAITVPQKAVLQGKNGLYVLVIDKENKAAMQPVDAGDWVGSDWIIKSGLVEGDVVIVDGVNKLMPGMTVISNKIPL